MSAATDRDSTVPGPEPLPTTSRLRSGTRSRSILPLGALVAALGVLVGWQTSSGLTNIERMMVERSAVLHRVVATEIVNVARYGASRRERLDAALRDLVEASTVVEGARLERRGGGLRIEHGALRGTTSAFADGLTNIRVGASVVVGGPLRLETQGCGETATRAAAPAEAEADASCGCGAPQPAARPATSCGSEGGCAPDCPAAGDESLDGDYSLVLALGIQPYLGLRTTVVWQGVGGGLLVVGLALGLWLFARQSRRAADMRQALALSAARGRHLENLALVAAGLAHEIKNPVGALRGFAQLIEERVPPGSDEAEYAALMVAELDGITRRINGLRQLVRPREPDWRVGRPSEVVGRVTALLAPDAAARELTLVADLPDPAEPSTRLDEQRLRELVVNLLMNAIEASPRSGRVVVSLAFQAAPAASAPEGSYTLEVVDEGPGIDPGEREACLRPFFSTKSGGLGLGLALALRAVEDHGGTLEIDRAPGAGACVRARWPRCTERADLGCGTDVSTSR